MGAGDVKLALGLGALAGAFGVDAWILAALGAPLLTALWGLLSRRRVLPHGPAMCAATALAVFLGDFGVIARAERGVLFGDIADTGMSRDIADT